MVEGVELLHGDCLELMRGIPDGSVDCIVTDPPYGISYQSARRTDKASRKSKIANDDHPFIWWLYDATRLLSDGGCLACFCEPRHADVFKIAIVAAGLTIKSQVVWDRGWHGMGDLKASFAPQHDIIWFATKGSFKFHGKRPKSVLRYKRLSGTELVHPTEKPVGLIVDLIESICPVGGTVLDPLMGSGTTGVACLNTNRKFIGIEKDEKYFDIAEKRLIEAGAIL